MALRQPERALLSFFATKRGNHLDSRILHLTGHSPYGYLYGKNLGGNRKSYRPPLNLTTIGCRSGRRHTVALSYFAVDDAWGVVGSALGSAAEPHWVRNLRANPAAWVRLNRRTIPVTATVLDGEDKRTLWEMISQRTRVFVEFQRNVERDIPIVVLRPRQP